MRLRRFRAKRIRRKNYGKQYWRLKFRVRNNIVSLQRMSLNREIEAWFNGLGTDFVRFMDISDLPEKQNRGYSHAILFCDKSTICTV